MKYAIIDIGSNSMRLTVYEAENHNFKILFKEKIMAGLAGYVENGCISEDGIHRAYEGLLEFKNTLELLGITEKIYVFATASLRNIINTDEAVAKITAATGFPIDVISGEEEAQLGYIGAMHELSAADGTFVDIGGASTEITIFAAGSVLFSKSYRIGSLNLYKNCVKKILPGDGSVKRIRGAVNAELQRQTFDGFIPQKQLICTGGTARSILKFAKHIGLVSDSENTISAEELKEVGKLFLDDSKVAADAILKVDPERIHTIIPGYLILQSIAEQFESERITVSNYGVREGYLCQKVLA
ncbi:MAG: hypothetical protein ACI4FZ_03420 [Lachnospiraceae bacterium]